MNNDKIHPFTFYSSQHLLVNLNQISLSLFLSLTHTHSLSLSLSLSPLPPLSPSRFLHPTHPLSPCIRSSKVFKTKPLNLNLKFWIGFPRNCPGCAGLCSSEVRPKFSRPLLSKMENNTTAKTNTENVEDCEGNDDGLNESLNMQHLKSRNFLDSLISGPKK